MNKVKTFYKDMYGEDAPKEFESMKSKTLFDFAEAYSQEQIKLLNLACVTQRSELLIDFCSSVECYQINTGQVELADGVNKYLKSINCG